MAFCYIQPRTAEGEPSHRPDSESLGFVAQLEMDVSPSCCLPYYNSNCGLTYAGRVQTLVMTGPRLLLVGAIAGLGHIRV